MELLGKVEGSCVSQVSIIYRSSMNVSLPSSACNTFISVCQLCEVLLDTFNNQTNIKGIHITSTRKLESGSQCFTKSDSHLDRETMRGTDTFLPAAPLLPFIFFLAFTMGLLNIYTSANTHFLLFPNSGQFPLHELLHIGLSLYCFKDEL